MLLDGDVDDIVPEPAEMPTPVLKQLLQLEKGAKRARR